MKEIKLIINQIKESQKLYFNLTPIQMFNEVTTQNRANNVIMIVNQYSFTNREYLLEYNYRNQRLLAKVSRISESARYPKGFPNQFARVKKIYQSGSKDTNRKLGKFFHEEIERYLCIPYYTMKVNTITEHNMINRFTEQTDFLRKMQLFIFGKAFNAIHDAVRQFVDLPEITTVACQFPLNGNRMDFFIANNHKGIIIDWKYKIFRSKKQFRKDADKYRKWLHCSTFQVEMWFVSLVDGQIIKINDTELNDEEFYKQSFKIGKFIQDHREKQRIFQDNQFTVHRILKQVFVPHVYEFLERFQIQKDEKNQQILPGQKNGLKFIQNIQNDLISGSRSQVTKKYFDFYLSTVRKELIQQGGITKETSPQSVELLINDRLSMRFKVGFPLYFAKMYFDQLDQRDQLQGI